MKQQEREKRDGKGMQVVWDEEQHQHRSIDNRIKKDQFEYDWDTEEESAKHKSKSKSISLFKRPRVPFGAQPYANSVIIQS